MTWHAWAEGEARAIQAADRWRAPRAIEPGGPITFASNDSVTVRQPPLKPITSPLAPTVTLRLPPPPVTGIDPTITGKVTCTSRMRFTRFPPLRSA